MKLKNYIFLLALVLIGSLNVTAQVGTAFTPRLPAGNVQVKGDVVLIGNTVINKAATAPIFSPSPPVNGVTYTGTVTNLATLTAEANTPNNAPGNNNDFRVEYIDIDTDNTTFSSSTANLNINNACKRIVFAGLYWSAIYPYERSTNTSDKYQGSLRNPNFNQIKFRIPGGAYQDITADQTIFDGYNAANVPNSFKDAPYVCFKDVTGLVSALPNADGDYTVANVRAARGQRNGGGAGGWTLVVVYESPTLPSKYISIFDGYVGVNPDAGPGQLLSVDFNVNGFRTLPTGFPVNARIGVAALEGDFTGTGDTFQIKANSVPGFTPISDAANPANNFFNASISRDGANVTARVPNGYNNLGFDIDNFRIPNPLNGTIPNNETGATLRLTTSGDGYGAFVTTFAVDVIEPNILLTKEVKNSSGVLIGNQDVNLGQALLYEIGFQNQGNDNATNFTIKDVLPQNVTFNYPADLVLPATTPAITHTYNAATRTIIFTIPSQLVEINDPRLKIGINVRVVTTCSLLSDACSNIIQNQAFATYRGQLNPAQITDDPSLSSFTSCNLGSPNSTNFLVDIDDCLFNRNEILCGDSVILTASNGYTTYSWTNSSGAVIGNTQSITVTQPGVYTVTNTIVGCVPIKEVVTVTRFGATVSNPIRPPQADEVVICPNDGKELPNIFLCGGSEFIQTNITDAQSITWERLNEASCPAVTNSDCANENTSCTWTQVATGPNYNADTAGQYRITLRYQGGCFNRFYFNVYKNVFNPTATSRDIICNTAGEIVVNNAPSGYEYSLSPTGPFDPNNVFVINTPGTYTVYIRQINGGPSACVFTVPNINIIRRDFIAAATPIQPFCTGGKGSIIVQANNVRPQYFFSLYQGATLINSVGPITQSDYTFPNLNPGTYTYNASTEDGCAGTGTVTIIDPPLLTATAAITKPLTCTDGEVTVYPAGGTPPYVYYVNSTTVFTTDPVIPITTPGTYNIQVVDANNCIANTSITVAAILPPAYTVTKTDILCAGSGNTGSISINVSNANGNSLQYSIDNGANYFNTNLFTNLAAGNYNVVVQYTTGGSVCTSAPQAITINANTAITGTAALTTPYTCTSTGTITVSGVSGGTPGYTYSINGTTFQASNVFTGLTNGTYTITIRDTNNCTFVTAPITVDPISGPTDLDIRPTLFISCPTNTGNLNVQLIAGGISPVRFRIISPPAYVTPYNSSGNFLGLPAGTYCFEVIDKNNCTYQECYRFDPLPPAVIVPQVVNNVRCFGTASGNAQFTITGIPNNTKYDYTLSPSGVTVSGTTPNTGSTTIIVPLNNQPAGTYSISVYNDSDKCTYNSTLTITQPAAALTVNTTVTPITCAAPGGSVVINATGGWGGNSYSLTQPNAVVLGPQTGNTFTNLTQTGTYTVTTTDSNGCVVTNTFTLTAPVAPTATIAVASDYCYDATNAATLVVTATGGVAPYQYNINGGAFQSSNTFAGLVPGTYTIIVRDSYGCTFTLPAQTIASQLTVATTLTKDLDCTASPNAVISGTISGGYPVYTAQVSYNGGANTAVTVTGNTFTYTATAAGTYQFLITDNRGCTTTSTITTVNPIVNPTATTTQTNITCNGLSNGSVTIIPSSGVGPYTFSFNGSPFTTTATYSSLAAGTYPYQVRDSKSCLFTGSVIITQPGAIAGTATLTTPYTCTSTGTITVSGVSGGTPGYTYSINGTTFQASNVFTGLTNGTYTITIRDANNCTFVTAPITIAPLNPPTDIAFSATAVTCPSNTSDVTLSVTGTNTPYTYQIIAPTVGASQTGNVFNNLAPGTYTFEVTDSKNCTYQESYTIAPLAPVTVAGQLISNVQCFGTATGSVRYTVGGFSPSTYSYTINGGAAVTGQTAPVINLTGLAAGTYTIVVTNTATSCTATTAVTVSQPAAALTVNTTVTPITCAASGSVVINATGGWGGNSYSLTQPNAVVLGPQTGNTFANLTQTGAYTASVTDANGCTVTSSFTLTAPVAPTATIAASDYCYDATNAATLVVTATGGVAPYEYNINGGAYQTSNTFAGLVPGTYTIIVRDSYGCTFTLPAQTIAAQLTVATTLTKDFDCTTTPPNAVITGTISGGYPVYTAQVSYNGGANTAVTVTGSGFTYTATLAGTYQFFITDSRGCTTTSTITTVNPISLPVITSVIQTQQILCFGEATGAIQVNIDTTVGTPAYVINVLNTTTGINYGTQTSGLPAGNYTITLTDAKSCTDTETIVIGQPALIDFMAEVNPITCGVTGTSFGSICVRSLTGGTAGATGYVYTLTNNIGALTQTYTDLTGADYCFTVLNFGIYELSVTDANNCTVTKQNLEMASPPSDLTIDVSSATASCASGATVVVTVSAPVPVGPYYFAIYQSPYPLYPSPAYQPADAGFPLQSTFTGLTPGVTYSFIVYDDTTKCYYFKQASAPTQTPSTLNASIDNVRNVTCKGNADGNVTFTISGYTATSVTYQFFNSQTNAPSTPPISATLTGLTGTPFTVSNVGPLAPGTYYILFTENDGSNPGCTNASATFTVTESAVALTLTASITKNDNCNVNAGQIAAIAQGGTAPYTYQILPAASPAPIATSPGWVAANTLNAESGNYVAYVKDANNCIVSTPITLGLDPSPVVAAAVNNQCTATEGNFAIDVTLPTAGVGPYSYSIDGGAFQNQTAPFTVSNLASGTHTVQVRDFNGCGNTVSVTILAPLGVTPAITALPTCANNDGVITVAATGGSGTYSYSISPNPAGVTLAGNVFSGVPSGTYTITVTDGTTTCTRNATVTLSAATPVTFTTTATNVSCDGDSNGTITVTLPASNDNPIYTYEILAPIVVAPQTSNVFTGLAAGTYTIRVNSGRGCSATQDQLVDQPTPLTVTGTATPFTCAANNSVNTSTVTVTEGAGSGTAPYTYSIDGTNYFTSNTFQVIDNGAVQSIIVYVRDNNGCIATNTVTINPLPTLTGTTVTQTTAITCTNPEVVSIAVTGGSGNFTYQLLPSGAPQASNVFSLPAPGDYYFQVNDVTTGCYIATAVYTVAPFNNINVVATATTPVTCFGDANGAITINVTGYTGPYNYQLFDSSGAPVGGSVAGNTATNPLLISGLAAGNYTVQITETAAPFCVRTSNVTTVGSPSAAVALTLVSNTNANCNTGSQVTVNGSGGTPGYTYAFVQNAVIPVAGDYFATNTANLNPATNTQWDVYVRDTNGCFTFIDVTIAMDPAPTVTAPAFASDQCTSNGTAYNFTVTGTGIAPLTYSVGAGFQSSPSFTVNTAGTYTVTIRDGNGCTATDTIIIYAPLGVTPAITALPTCANNDGVITVAATGGSGTYSYSISPNPAGVTLAGNVFSGVPSGTYTITVTDGTTTCTRNATVTLSAATPVTFTTTATNVSCDGDSNGTITVTLPASNDNPIYTYEILAPIVVAPQTSNVFTGLAAGTYTIRVNSGRGCSATQDQLVDQPTPLTVTGTATPFTCAANNSVNTSTVTVTEGAGSGTAPYTYSIDGTNYFTSNTFQVIDNGAVQSIIVYVRDNNGCIATNTVTINPLPTLTGTTVTQTTAITCTNPEVVSIAVTGGSGNFTYQLLPSGAPQASNVFSLPAPGDYYFQVNDVTTGCYIATAVYTVAPFNNINVVATATTPVTCFGDANGAITINVTGYTGPYNYQLFDSSGAPVGGSVAANTSTGPLLISGLASGNYTVQVTETAAPFCVRTSNVTTVGSPSAPLTVIAQETSNVTCTNNQGTIVASASGGWGAYQYELVGPTSFPYSTNNTYSGLSAGTYTVNVRDLRGCIVSTTLTLAVPTPINAVPVASTTLLTCFGDTNATISVTNVTGGQGSNYTYTLNTIAPVVSSSSQASPVFGGLGAGTYSITVTDAYNCTFTSANIVIGQPGEVIASLSVATTQTCTTQTTLTLTGSGGTAPYSYSLDGVTYIAGTFNPSITFPVAPGTYQYYIRDANGCESRVSNQIVIDPLPPLTIDLTASNISLECNGDNSGVIDAVGQGGLGNYLYTLQDGAGAVILGPQASGNFTGLFAGFYTVVVDSGDCQTTSAVIEIDEPDNPLAIVTNGPVDVTCAGANNGSIVITGTGGTGLIQYSITPPNEDQFFNSGTFVDLAPGNYTITVQDQNGCFVPYSFTINEPNPLVVATVPGSIVQELCAGDRTGAFSINITEGTAPYSVSLDNANGPFLAGTATQTQFDFTMLSGGTHIVYIRDANGCDSRWTVDLNPSVDINPQAAITYNCDDNQANTVVISVNTSVQGQVEYALDGGAYQQSNTFTVNPGPHFVDVRHTNGCIKTVNFTVELFEPIALVLNDGGLNEIVAVASGGSGGYQFELDGVAYGNDNTYIITQSGTYTVRVTDSNGCTTTASRYFEFIDIFIPDVFTPDGDGINDGWTPQNTINYKNLVFYVFDRYGRKLGTFKEGQFWDGKYNGTELPTGDYWYVIKIDGESDREFVGNFTLYR